MTGDDHTRREESPETTDYSRRRFLATGIGAAGALALGAATTAAEEVCNSEFGTIDVADGFTLLDNRWGMDDATQCIRLNDDGSYGYEFDATSTSGGINYPEVFVGTRPWGDDTGVPEFPLRRGDVDELVIDLEASLEVGGGEWDWAEEWWLLEDDPTENPETHRYEIMLLLDWGGGHDHGTVRDPEAWTDRFGNTVSLWTVYDSGGTDADFYIFRIEGGHDGGKIDMGEIVEYLTAEEDISEDLLISGLELGNEYWGGASGEVTYEQFDVHVNGSTYSSGSGGATSDGSGDDSTDDTDDSTDDSDDSTDDSDDSTDDSDDSTDDTDDSTDDSDDSTDDTDDSDDSNDDTDDSADDKSDLVAEIDPDTTTPAVGEQVDFHLTDTSGSGRWLSDLAWSLGDGTTQTGWHADHSYESAGEYTVELEATASDGTTTTDAVTVEVGDDTSEDSSDDGEDDTSEDGSDDGEDDTSEDDTDDGDDDTSEDDTDDGEDDTSEDSSDDGEGSEETPHGEISASATTVSPGERVTFELTANESWLTGIEWDLDDGTTDSGSWHVTHSYDTAGTYTVSLETQSGQTGEWTTDTVTITVE